MTSPVMILNDDRHLKAVNLADRLIHAEIAFTYQKVGVQHTITVEERDVKAARIRPIECNSARKFVVFNLDTLRIMPGEYDTLEEARGAVAFDGLRNWTIDRGDVCHARSGQ